MKVFVSSLIVSILLATAIIFIFSSSGENSLIRVIRYTLLADIPDNRYGWSDFLASSKIKRV